MEDQLISIVASEIQKFGALINWTFAFTFIMTSYVVNEISKRKLNSKMKTWLRSLITGVCLSALFFLLSRKYNLEEVTRYVVSMAFSMFVLWDG